MRFVAVKTVEQQDLQAMHRIRAELRGSQDKVGKGETQNSENIVR